MTVLLKLAPSVVVKSLRRIDGRGALKGFASVTIDNKLTIHGCKIIDQPNSEGPWVAYPQTEQKDPNGGKSKYFPIIEILDATLKKEIQAAVLSVWGLPAAVPADKENIPW